MSPLGRLVHTLLITFIGLIMAVFIISYIGLIMLATQPETECPSTNIEWSFK